MLIIIPSRISKDMLLLITVLTTRLLPWDGAAIKLVVVFFIVLFIVYWVRR